MPVAVQMAVSIRGGNEEPSTSRLNYRDSTIGNTTRVGRYPAGANGLYDMAGNVREWTSTQYEDYPYKVNDGREGQDGDNRRTLRGGSFNYNRNDVRCAIRDSLVPWLDWNNDGFRVVMLESPDFLPNESSGP